MRLDLPGWADMHVHFRQGAITPALVKAHVDSGCKIAVAMPNTVPPIDDVGRIADYLDKLGAAARASGVGDFQDMIVPLYLTRRTTPAMIDVGAKSGTLRAAKYYPPHGTTNSEHGIPMGDLIGGDVLYAMEDAGIILCVHGEQHGVTGEKWFGRHSNAELDFYREDMQRLRDVHPDLRIVCEHISTLVARDFVMETPRCGATVTPMHLLHTVGDLLQGWYAHLKCMPIVKFQDDVDALLDAVRDPANRKFFAGTDSAPHPQAAKHTDCGCASGCFTGGIAPQLYAQAFSGGAPNIRPATARAFMAFMSENGPDFYGIARPQGSLVLVDQPQDVVPLETPVGSILPLPVGMLPASGMRKATIPWRIERVS